MSVAECLGNVRLLDFQLIFLSAAWKFGFTIPPNVHVCQNLCFWTAWTYSWIFLFHATYMTKDQGAEISVYPLAILWTVGGVTSSEVTVIFIHIMSWCTCSNMRSKSKIFWNSKNATNPILCNVSELIINISIINSGLFEALLFVFHVSALMHEKCDFEI